MNAIDTKPVLKANGLGYDVLVDGRAVGSVRKVERRASLAGGRGRGTLITYWLAEHANRFDDDRNHHSRRTDAVRSIVEHLEGEVASAGSIKNGVVTAFEEAEGEADVVAPTAAKVDFQIRDTRVNGKWRTIGTADNNLTAVIHATTDRLQRNGFRYSEIVDHVSDLLQGYVLTADNGFAFRLVDNAQLVEDTNALLDTLEAESLALDDKVKAEERVGEIHAQRAALAQQILALEEQLWQGIGGVKYSTPSLIDRSALHQLTGSILPRYHWDDEALESALKDW